MTTIQEVSDEHAGRAHRSSPPAAAHVPDHLVELQARWPSIRPFVAAGGACVLAGGLVAAVSRPLGLELGSWAAAYLVLVGGIGQGALGGGRAWLARDAISRRRTIVEASLWNIGLAGTLVGSLGSVLAATALGGACTAAALALLLLGVRHPRPGRRALSVAYVGLASLILVSTPIGLALAWVRHT